MRKSIVIIPARYGSTRLSRKVLLNETGKYLIQHTYEQALKARQPDKVVVATDDQRVLKAVQGFGGFAVMTSKKHQSGTDRIAQAVRLFPGYDIIVNLQGDEPEIEPSAIDRAISIARQKNIDIGTLASPVRNQQEFFDPNKVKVVVDKNGLARYFSRSPIPYPREKKILWDGLRNRSFLRHLGLYAYKRVALLRLTELPPAPLEKIEQLEQLRALTHGFRIKVGVVAEAPFGIDTRSDYQEFVKRLRRAK